MKIALIGYGKMGHTIERIAIERGHEIVLKVTSQNLDEFTTDNLKQADVAIEFTKPEAALANITKCFDAGVSVVCGTTGWNKDFQEARALAITHNVAFLQASNFSIGVNIFFEINKKLAALMNKQPDYYVTIEEIHHTEKKDAPSGTAITIAEQIVAEIDRKHKWTLDGVNKDELNITALREPNVPGTHTVTYNSAVDKLDFVHTAHNRDGFALGAVLAAEFLNDKSGVFEMKDVLGI